MDPIVVVKKSTDDTQITTRQGIKTQSKLLEGSSDVVTLATTNCGSNPGQKSCWNVVTEDYTCIPDSNICCGDGHSCPSHLRCDAGTCVSIAQSYALCPPPM
jgi:hypothetical protein